MRLDDGFPDALDGFLAGRPWTGPIPEGAALLEAMRRPDRLASILERHAAERLTTVDLSPYPSLVPFRGKVGPEPPPLDPPKGTSINADVLLPLAAAAQLEQASFGPEGLVELAAACARTAEERGLARNLAEDALCSLATERLPPFPAPASEDTVKTLRRLSAWSLLAGDLESLDDDQARTAGEWLAESALPAGRPGRFPLRKLLLQPLVAAAEVRDPLPHLAVLAGVLQPVAARGLTAHVADFYECYCGWMETRGPRDADVRRVLRRLDSRDVESERWREGVAAAAFFVVLARLDPAAVRRAPRLHRSLLQAARHLAGRLPLGGTEGGKTGPETT